MKARKLRSTWQSEEFRHTARERNRSTSTETPKTEPNGEVPPSPTAAQRKISLAKRISSPRPAIQDQRAGNTTQTAAQRVLPHPRRPASKVRRRYSSFP